MEGFNTDKIGKLLRLKEQGYRNVVLLAPNYKNEEKDWLANMKKYVHRSDIYL